jgi:hypothetical protein
MKDIDGLSSKFKLLTAHNQNDQGINFFVARMAAGKLI